MGVGRQTVLAEYIVARFYHTVVVGVDVAHINPCPYAMVLQVQSLLLQQGDVLVEEHDGLDVGAEVRYLVVGQSQTLQREGVGLVAGLQQHGNFCAADRRLLYDGMGGVADDVGHQGRMAQLVVLVGDVAQEHLCIM